MTLTDVTPETFKWVVQIIASIATAILTAMGTVSCIGY